MPNKESILNNSRALDDAKEFSMQGSEAGLGVPCQPPPCRGCKPCVSCSQCRGGVSTAEASTNKR